MTAPEQALIKRRICTRTHSLVMGISSFSHLSADRVITLSIPLCAYVCAVLITWGKKSRRERRMCIKWIRERRTWPGLHGCWLPPSAEVWHFLYPADAHHIRPPPAHGIARISHTWAQIHLKLHHKTSLNSSFYPFCQHWCSLCQLFLISLSPVSNVLFICYHI